LVYLIERLAQALFDPLGNRLTLSLFWDRVRLSELLVKFNPSFLGELGYLPGRPFLLKTEKGILNVFSYFVVELPNLVLLLWLERDPHEGHLTKVSLNIDLIILFAHGVRELEVLGVELLLELLNHRLPMIVVA